MFIEFGFEKSDLEETLKPKKEVKWVFCLDYKSELQAILPVSKFNTIKEQFAVFEHPIENTAYKFSYPMLLKYA